MQLGFVSAILPELTLEEVFAFAADEGFDCVELMCWPVCKAERKYAGVTHVDVSGSGGTSWVAVEAHRAVDETERQLADELWDWGIPTAASLVQLQGLGLKIVATGGLRTGTDVAKAVALGATAGGLAAPLLKAHRAGGYDGAVAFLQSPQPRRDHRRAQVAMMIGARGFPAGIFHVDTVIIVAHVTSVNIFESISS